MFGTQTYKVGELTKIISQHRKKRSHQNQTENEERKKLEALFSPLAKGKNEDVNGTKSKKLKTGSENRNCQNGSHQMVKKKAVKKLNQKQKERKTEKKLKSLKKLNPRKKKVEEVEEFLKTTKAYSSKSVGSPRKEEKHTNKIRKKKSELTKDRENKHLDNPIDKSLLSTPTEEIENLKPTFTDREEQRKNRKKFKKKRDTDADSRTVFVGNLPIQFDKRQLKRLFRKCGEIQSVRFRCPPPADPRIPKKVISIKKDFHEERPSGLGFVCFKEEEYAKKALKLNGLDIEGFHIRVDLASSDKKHDHKCSVFVGNLPFVTNEEDVRSHFQDCGKIVNVRIIRDNKTGLGKGFCYVTFETKDSVGFAMSMNGKEFNGRELRVLCSQEHHKPTKTTKSLQSNENEKGGPPAKKKFKASNDTTKTFQGLKIRVNKKKLQKKRDKLKAKSRDQIIFKDKKVKYISTSKKNVTKSRKMEKNNKPVKEKKNSKKRRQ